MEQTTTIGLDIAKHVFQVQGRMPRPCDVPQASHAGEATWFLAAQAPVLSRWRLAPGRTTGAGNQQVGSAARLIPPAYVKPFVKRQKNDAADAEAICEAAQPPSMRFVPVKDEEQRQTASCSGPYLLVRQRTQCINALRGHLSRDALRRPTTIAQSTMKSSTQGQRRRRRSGLVLGNRLPPALLKFPEERGKSDGKQQCSRQNSKED